MSHGLQDFLTLLAAQGLVLQTFRSYDYILKGGKTARMHVTQVLYADDMTMTADDPHALQTMLNRSNLCARKQHLFINTAKSEVVHFNLSGPSSPVFRAGGMPLAP
eukprot:1156888-Pelagomonas_calceolata.AAC.12